MSFLTILKIIPWILTLAGAGTTVFYRMRMKWLDEKFDEHTKTIKNLKDIVLDQGVELDKKEKQISELMEINAKYEKKKSKIKDGRSATASMASKR